RHVRFRLSVEAIGLLAGDWLVGWWRLARGVEGCVCVVAQLFFAKGSQFPAKSGSLAGSRAQKSIGMRIAAGRLVRGVGQLEVIEAEEKVGGWRLVIRRRTPWDDLRRNRGLRTARM